jgi:stage III sporulation protein AF
MEMVYSWVKSIVFFLVLLTIINNLVGKSGYKKYINLITGMILIILVVSPLINLFNINQKLDYYFSKNTFMTDSDNINNELIKMEETQMSRIMDEYKNEIKVQTEKLLEKEGLYISNIFIEIDEEEGESFGTIKHLDLTASYMAGDQSDISSNITKVEIDKIQISEDEKAKEEKHNLSPTEINVKNLLSDFYNIEPDNINISIQE